jgi:hypothetical protein
MVGVCEAFALRAPEVTRGLNFPLRSMESQA